MRKNGKYMVMLVLLFALCCAAPCALARSYSLDDEAEEIAALQSALTELKFYYTDITGHYGKRTQAAVLKFQKRYGLPQTGVADENTAALIYQKAGVDAPKTSTTLPQAGNSTTLREGSRSEAVRTLQENLTQLEYYSGSITGKYGRLTKEAVRRFQKANGLSADGIAGPRTFEALNAVLGGEQADAEQPSDAPESATTTAGSTSMSAAVSLLSVPRLNTERTLRHTSRSGYVTRLQNALIALGYYTGSADGYFGSGTEEAVRLYQTVKGLTVDGVAGRATLRSINKDLDSGTTAANAAID